MRDINLDAYATIEVWKGRRLYVSGVGEGAALFALPRGAMTLSGNKTTQFLTFGSAERTAVRVTGSTRAGRVEAIFQFIITSEHPADAKGWKQL